MADHTGIAAVACFPEAVPEKGDRGGAGSLVLGQEVAAQRGPLANEAEGIGRDLTASVILREGLRVGEIAEAEGIRAEAAELRDFSCV